MHAIGWRWRRARLQLVDCMQASTHLQAALQPCANPRDICRHTTHTTRRSCLQHDDVTTAPGGADAQPPACETEF